MLATREQAWAWDLRAAWAGGWAVSVVLEKECVPPRVRGWVSFVSSTGAFAEIDGVHVPCARILTVRRPHFHEKLDGDGPSDLRPRRVDPLPGQLNLFEEISSKD